MILRSLLSRPRAPRLIAAAAAMLVCFTSGGCSEGEQLSTCAAGHSITARIRGNRPTVEQQGDRTLLGSELGKVIVERTRMCIDGEPWIGIAENVPVTVNIEHGRISIRAGKVSVGRTVRY